MQTKNPTIASNSKSKHCNKILRRMAGFPATLPSDITATSKYRDISSAEVVTRWTLLTDRYTDYSRQFLHLYDFTQSLLSTITSHFIEVINHPQLRVMKSNSSKALSKDFMNRFWTIRNYVRSTTMWKLFPVALSTEIKTYWVMIFYRERRTSGNIQKSQLQINKKRNFL